MFWIGGRLWDVVAHESSTVFLKEEAKFINAFALLQTTNKLMNEIAQYSSQVRGRDRKTELLLFEPS